MTDLSHLDTGDLGPGEPAAVDADTVSGRGGPMRVDVTPSRLRVAPGQETTFAVEVTNTGPVIRSLQLEVLGLALAAVVVDPPVIVLFPDERATATVTLRLPEGHPAGPQPLAVELSDPTDPLPPIIVPLELDIVEKPRLEVRVDPGNVFAGRRATFTGVITNTGNGVLRPRVTVVDPESVVTAMCTPDALVIPPGQHGIVRLDMVGKRPWMGAPGVRVLTVTATHVDAEAADRGDPPAEDVATVSFVQRPWLGRRIFALAGLLMVATVLGLVFTASFKRVADATKANEDLLKQSLGVDAPVVTGPPAAMAGRVVAATGAGIEGVAIELFDVERGGLTPVRATVTDAEGAFRVAALAKGTYRLKVTAAGFGEQWFADATGFADAQDLAVEEGQELAGLEMKLVGRPAALAGKVLGDDLDGVAVVVRLPGAGGGATVKTVPVGADGAFGLAGLPAPATYEVVATAAVLTSEVRTVTVGPGDTLDGLTLLLRPGDGVVGGRVVDAAGVGIGGAAVTVASGTASQATVTLSGGPDTAGRFEVRGLRTPGTYSLTVDRPGFARESRTLALDAQQTAPDLSIVLVPATGGLGGAVLDAGGRPLGGVTVTVAGGDANRTTRTVSVVNPLAPAALGAWTVGDLPVPGSYTVTFAAPGLTSQTLALELTTTQPQRFDTSVTLTSAVASVHGTVRELGSDADPPTCDPADVVVTDCPGRLAGVQVTLASASTTRQTVSADIPSGTYRFDNVVPGAYTLTFSRVGSSPQTLFVELRAGEDRAIADVALERQARIVGTVTTNGVGTPNVGVRIYRIGTYPNVVAAATITDANGRFQIVGLEAPETYVVEFQVPAGGPVRVSRTLFLRPGESGAVDVSL